MHLTLYIGWEETLSRALVVIDLPQNHKLSFWLTYFHDGTVRKPGWRAGRQFSGANPICYSLNGRAEAAAKHCGSSEGMKAFGFVSGGGS